MIFGYAEKIVNEEYGLAQMREVSIRTNPASLRALAEFLRTAADELEVERPSNHWHRHVPNSIRESLGCDFIVLAPKDDDRQPNTLPGAAS